MTFKRVEMTKIKKENCHKIIDKISQIDLFWFVWWHINLYGLFNAEVILIEEQQ